MENRPALENPFPDTDSDSFSSCTRADADAGNADAQFGVALRLAAGPVPHDFTQAAQWYRKAADQNHRLAQFNLGQMFAHGQGVERDDSTAVMWMRRAANGGDAGAQFDLGNRYQRANVDGSDGEAIETRVECRKWFKLAAAQGYRDALIRADAATLHMSAEEIAEADRRVAAFIPD